MIVMPAPPEDPPDEFDVSDEPTPTSLLLEPHAPRTQDDLYLASLRQCSERISLLEKRVQELETERSDHVARQFKRLRKYLATWLGED